MSPFELGEVLPAVQLGEPWALRVVYDPLAPTGPRLPARAAPPGLKSSPATCSSPFGKLPNLTGGVIGLRTFTFSVAHARLVDALRKQSRRPDADVVAGVLDVTHSAGPM